MTLVVMECYEDMFKEITRKLYGEEEIGTVTVEYDTLSTLVANTIGDEIEATLPDKWTASEETLTWTTSKIASYNAAQKLFKCNECDSVGFLSRVAEHWLGTHANLRVFQCSQCPYTSAWARCVRMHLARQHNVTTEGVDTTETFWKENPILEEVTKYLQRLKDKVDSAPESQSEPTETPETTTKEFTQPAISLSVLQNSVIETNSGGKRYNCSYCSYATDRRDLFTRHENIHRDEKPFHCYICLKQFNRADHVKKHFVRIHRDVGYDLNKIRREVGKDPPPPPVFQPKPEPSSVIKEQVVGLQQVRIKVEKSALKRKPGEKRHTCPYCSWSGVDNWCLKRHLNTHLKPFGCSMCEYKAARSERLTFHMFKVHNKRACGKCSFLADDESQLTAHQQQQHP